MDEPVKYLKVQATNGSMMQILTFHGPASEIEKFKDAIRSPFEQGGFEVSFEEYNESDGRAVEFAFYFQQSVDMKQALESGVWEPQIHGPLLN